MDNDPHQDPFEHVDTMSTSPRPEGNGRGTPGANLPTPHTHTYTTHTPRALSSRSKLAARAQRDQRCRDGKTCDRRQTTCVYRHMCKNTPCKYLDCDLDHLENQHQPRARVNRTPENAPTPTRGGPAGPNSPGPASPASPSSPGAPGASSPAAPASSQTAPALAPPPPPLTYRQAESLALPDANMQEIEAAVEVLAVGKQFKDLTAAQPKDPFSDKTILDLAPSCWFLSNSWGFIFSCIYLALPIYMLPWTIAPAQFCGIVFLAVSMWRGWFVPNWLREHHNWFIKRCVVVYAPYLWQGIGFYQVTMVYARVIMQAFYMVAYGLSAVEKRKGHDRPFSTIAMEICWLIATCLAVRFSAAAMQWFLNGGGEDDYYYENYSAVPWAWRTRAPHAITGARVNPPTNARGEVYASGLDWLQDPRAMSMHLQLPLGLCLYLTTRITPCSTAASQYPTLAKLTRDWCATHGSSEPVLTAHCINSVAHNLRPSTECWSKVGNA